MEASLWTNPSLAVAIAVSAGMTAQALARHLRIPGIVALLAAGVLLGPDLLDVLRPNVLGEALDALVGFAVAVILFEGALNLNVKRLKEQAKSIRRLVTVGAAITAIGGAVSARYILGWDWRLSVLFGTLVIVTGPTVINPLVRRIRLRHDLATILEGEGVFGDAIGALVAVVALEIVVSPTGDSPLHWPLELLERLGLGAALGIVAGLLLGALLRKTRVIPEGFENVFILSYVWLLFQGSNALLPESGIVAVIAAGVTVANSSSRQLEDLREFKEQLTLLMLGVLFVLLAADVRVAEVTALGWGGLATVAVLMLVVRPINVLASTVGTPHSGREKAFLMWLAPRGIVAAAVASLFAQSLGSAGIAGGNELRAMVFLVIVVTVNVQGPTGGLVARSLGVQRAAEQGFVILGANPLGRTMGAALHSVGESVLFIDSNPKSCEAAEEDGFRVLYGNGLSERVLKRARLDERDGCIALTTNDEANFAFCRRAHLEYGVGRVWMPVHRGTLRVGPSMLEEIQARVVFGGQRHLERWVSITSSTPEIEVWGRESEDEQKIGEELEGEIAPWVLPLVLVTEGDRRPFDDTVVARPGDRLLLVSAPKHRQEVERRLRWMGWERRPQGATKSSPEE